MSLAGHAGKAFWFSKTSGEFVTSSYYYDQYPDWVKAWNARKPAQSYAEKSWELLHDSSKYLFGDADDREYETDFPGFGRTFPHPYGATDDKYFTTRLTLSPAGDELTLDFTRAQLFAYVDERIGLENTMIVPSADHGQPEVPGHLHELGIEDAHYFDTDALDKTPAITALKEAFGIGEDLIEAFFQPYVYLNLELIEPNVFINDFDGLTVASTHGSPWWYDTFVPVIFAGANLKAGVVRRAITPYDVAPTLADFLGVKPPSGSIGNPLFEIVPD